jgi:signal transduction histidine kinase
MTNSRTRPMWIAAGAATATVALLALLLPDVRRVLFATNGYTPHGVCLLWEPALLWTHVIADLLIGIAYVVIAAFLAALVYLARRDIPFHWVLLAFGAFIIACGGTHFIEVWTLWQPVYWFSAGAKVVTAVASVATAAALPPLFPKLLGLIDTARLSEARRHKLEQANHELGLLNRQITDLDAAKTRFFANVSHELRTPLTLILGPAERQLETPALTGEQRRDLETIVRNARTLLSYVGDLLDIATIEAGRLALDDVAVDLAQLVRRAAAHFDALATTRGITLAVDTPPTLLARLDAAKIQRVLLNLLGNAFKFTPDGGTVRCTLEARGEQIVLSVADSGPGVPPEQREAIFDRFHRGAGDHRGGTGLGLAIVQEFVALHGGAVSVDDAPEGGARFCVELPWRHADAAGLTTTEDTEDTTRFTARPSSEPAVNSVADPEQPLVLVIEDNPEMRVFLAETLAPYRIATASDGASGLEQARALQPDLILSDVMMPEMSGDELVRAIQAEPALASTPVVLLSARADEAFRVRALRDGAADYLLKPFAAEELRARVGNQLNIKHARDTLQVALASTQQDIAVLAGNLAARTAELEQALAVRDQFVAIAAHELKTPLTALLGNSQLMMRRMQRSGTLTERDERALQQIVSQSNRLHRLIETLLDISRADQGAIELTCTPLDLATVARRVVAEIAPGLERHTIETPAEGEPLLVYGDELRLEQVLYNLITNAVKYMPNGGMVRVKLLAEAERAGIAVVDEGLGIPAEAVPHLFERYYRAANVNHRHISGIGLGLAVVQQIVRLHGGTITVESAEGAGSTFTIRLPRHRGGE